MTLDELIDRVDRIVQDDNFDETEITKYLNRGVLQIARGVRRPDSSILTPPLPMLFEIGTVSTTTTFKVDLPVDYQRDLVFAADSIGRELAINDSFQEFVKTYPALNTEGTLNALAVKGRVLYYQGIPEDSEAITIHYHRYPVEMIVGSDEPDGIPEDLQDELLVNYACKEIYAIKEQGIDGSSFNTNKHEQKFQIAVEALSASIAADAPPFSFFA